MRIAFFSEIGSNEGIQFPRTFPNMRVDCAWAVALNAKVYSFTPDVFPDIDLAITICPKNAPEKCFRFFEKFNGKCFFANMQEAQNSYWQDYNIENQIRYLNFISSVDFILCHNEIDKKYYRGLIPDKKVSVLQSLMIEDAIPVEVGKVSQSVNFAARSGTMIGGNMCSWYGGMDSLMIAQEFGEKVYAPSMGRKVTGEETIEGLTHLPYMSWSQWISELSKMKYAVHLMRTFAAGTFSLNCARLSIPCISWNSLDTQVVCHPELSFDEGDMVSARKAAKNLKENEQFYNHCAAAAFKNYQDNFTEEKFLERFYSNFDRQIQIK